jgi:predicted alpha/beta-fold hydrolase
MSTRADEPSHNRTVTWGYPTEDAYYRDASCADGIMAIRIPFFAISAADDPVREIHRELQRAMHWWTADITKDCRG